ncbi:MAG: hypothetical protein JRC86_05450 [Deltaproteobacteria bacterium]|nr:hypothetical protein [Deltaproteobacteria bacterium]
MQKIFDCDLDSKDKLILHCEDQVAIELHSSKDDILLTDDDAENMADQILEYLADKRADKAVKEAEDRQGRAEDAREDEQMQQYYERKYEDD